LTLLKTLILSLVAAFCFMQSVAAQQTKSYTLRSDTGLRCAAFDYAKGLMVSSAHCLDGDKIRLSDGRTASVLNQGTFNSATDEFDATARDIGLLIPSTSRKILPRDRRPIELGSILYLYPPESPPIACPLVEQKGLTLIVACSSKLGWSGSPLMRVSRFGRLRVIGVLSAFEPSAGLSCVTHISI
jgi:hypothetical protein